MGAEIAQRLGTGPAEALLTVITAAGVYAAMIVLSRLFRQREFAVSGAYDLAFVFAIGSIAGRVVLVRVSLLTAVIGLATLFALHAATNRLHHHNPGILAVLQNRPVLLVADGEILPGNVRRARTSDAEVSQALRTSGIGSLTRVAAVILERNGEFSVIRSGEPLDEGVLAGVIGGETLLSAR